MRHGEGKTWQMATASENTIVVAAGPLKRKEIHILYQGDPPEVTLLMALSPSRSEMVMSEMIEGTVLSCVRTGRRVGQTCIQRSLGGPWSFSGVRVCSCPIGSLDLRQQNHRCRS